LAPVNVKVKAGRTIEIREIKANLASAKHSHLAQERGARGIAAGAGI